MNHRFGWRLSLSYVLLIVLVMVGLGYVVTQPICQADGACITRGILVASAILALGAFGIGAFVAERRRKRVNELLRVLSRLAEGDVNARVLAKWDGQIGQLAQAINLTIDHLREHVDLLTEENQQFSMVMEKMADGVLITDRLSYVMLINDAALRLLKTTEAGALGRPFAEVVRHHQLIDLWQATREEGREQVAAVEIGRDLFLQAYVTPYQQNGSRGYLVILQDLTQVRRLQTVRRDFISNISHELRTPLASLRAVVETLDAGALEDPPAARRFLSRAERELDTMTQMVEELLELSRIESGQVPLRVSAVDVRELVRVPLERLRPQAERARLNISVNFPAELPRVLADPDRMQQVFSNLIHNAIKFTPEGGDIEVRAELVTESSEAYGNEVEIAVKDTGVGIPADDLPRIFERFYKSDRARTRTEEGTGLGLAIARHLVQAHGGRLWAKSKPGKGSTFFFTLPVADAAVNHSLTIP